VLACPPLTLQTLWSRDHPGRRKEVSRSIHLVSWLDPFIRVDVWIHSCVWQRVISSKPIYTALGSSCPLSLLNTLHQGDLQHSQQHGIIEERPRLHRRAAAANGRPMGCCQPERCSVEESKRPPKWRPTVSVNRRLRTIGPDVTRQGDRDHEHPLELGLTQPPRKEVNHQR
jgi:hypothetical protein